MIEINGYTYSAITSKTLKKRWRCSTHMKKGCRSYIITLEDAIIAGCDIHNHPSPLADRKELMIRVVNE